MIEFAAQPLNLLLSIPAGFVLIPGCVSHFLRVGGGLLVLPVYATRVSGGRGLVREIYKGRLIISARYSAGLKIQPF